MKTIIQTVYFVYAADRINFYLIFINDRLFEMRVFSQGTGYMMRGIQDIHGIYFKHVEIDDVLEEIEKTLKESGLYEKMKNKQLTQQDADEIVRIALETRKKYTNTDVYRLFKNARRKCFDVAVLSC